MTPERVLTIGILAMVFVLLFLVLINADIT